jgi:hypothetical protein
VKLKRPNITPGPWVKNGSYVTGPDGLIAILQNGAFIESIGDTNAKAIAALPEVMDLLEELLAWEELMGGWDGPVFTKLKTTMLAMGYTEEKEGRDE